MRDPFSWSQIIRSLDKKQLKPKIRIRTNLVTLSSLCYTTNYFKHWTNCLPLVEKRNSELARNDTISKANTKKSWGFLGREHGTLSRVHYKKFLGFKRHLHGLKKTFNLANIYLNFMDFTLISFHVQLLLLQGIVTMSFHICCWVHKKSCKNSKLWMFSKFYWLWN